MKPSPVNPRPIPGRLGASSFMGRLCRRVFFHGLGLLLLLGAGCAILPGQPDRIIKVLPQYLDLEGRHTLAASLFERDAYQAWLREHSESVSGIRYMVQWRARQAGEYRLRLELQGNFEGTKPKRATLELPVNSSAFTARWSAVEFLGEPYEAFGPIISWRVTLWEGETMVDEEHSFLWN